MWVEPMKRLGGFVQFGVLVDMESQFELVLRGFKLTTLEVVYFMTDYQHLLQSFIFQDYDKAPVYPRMNRFLRYWHREIEASIKEVWISDSGQGMNQFRRVDEVFRI